MTGAGWRLADVEASNVAMPYGGKPGRYEELGLYGYPDFPAGLLRASVRQLSKFLCMFMNGGELGGSRILETGTVTEMMEVHVPASGEDPDQGFVWYYEQLGAHRVLLHDGQYPGAYTIMGFDPEKKVGAILLSNGNAEGAAASDDAMYALFAQLLHVAENL
jgi:CubicO group peptidase (beta-lactamase class C family)